ncbi:unnamed protein product [Dovyalis caffra]|uniref:Uncharacterized protein n=1 Tax=Dovyalis caffra TaxID=77055 RepID=A0AAV1RYV6_9ROSI|nr:unnamed protein product [Dovyalis caffra]
MYKNKTKREEDGKELLQVANATLERFRASEAVASRAIRGFIKPQQAKILENLLMLERETVTRARKDEDSSENLSEKEAARDIQKFI